MSCKVARIKESCIYSITSLSKLTAEHSCVDENVYPRTRRAVEVCRVCITIQCDGTVLVLLAHIRAAQAEA